MNILLKNIFSILLFLLSSSYLKGQNMQSTNYSTNESIVLQVCPEETAGETAINGNKYRRTAAYIFLPHSKTGLTVSCPLNYFQESCSISEKWVLIIPSIIAIPLVLAA